MAGRTLRNWYHRRPTASEAVSPAVNYVLTVDERSDRGEYLAALAAFWPHKDAQCCRLEQLGLDVKQEHEGFELWVKCMADNPVAWGVMESYCRNDVRITEQLYDRLLPWIPAHPSYGALTGADVCPSCGSAHLQHRGVAITASGRYQRMHCQACGKCSKVSKAEARTGITQLAG